MTWFSDLFGSKPKQKPFHHIVEIKGPVTIHVVSDSLQYGNIEAQFGNYKGYITGLPDSPVIWLQGKIRKGKVVPKWGYRVGGHEFWHTINRKLPNIFSNPDKILIRETDWE